MARIVGQKKAREIWFLCRYYNAREALDMGLVNTVVPLDELELVRCLVVMLLLLVLLVWLYALFVSEWYHFPA